MRTTLHVLNMIGLCLDFLLSGICCCCCCCYSRLCIEIVNRILRIFRSDWLTFRVGIIAIAWYVCLHTLTFIAFQIVSHSGLHAPYNGMCAIVPYARWLCVGSGPLLTTHMYPHSTHTNRFVRIHRTECVIRTHQSFGIRSFGRSSLLTMQCVFGTPQIHGSF